ncbi:MarR family winged helix-turn-helix transcriptional regulator [Paenibacillus silviterrae]|uniref:MarR family winged helix-turn-helix transcriptional regulator n=1 Tax=Paenibacillus silviterrae TaxID=3242194 RepID=UPI002542B6C5|nr:MarR family transcriptional regulator [Paenibacillus chinjuensis]
MEQALPISLATMKLSRSYTATMEKIFLKEFKLTKPQMLCISEISYGPKTIGQITEAMHLSYSTVSGIIDRLERDGWIRRVRDKEDRRVTWIQKTEQLEQIKVSLFEHQQRFYSSVLEGLEPAELDRMLQSLHLLSERLEKKVAEEK